MAIEFKPNKQGFNDLRNKGFIQKVCLKRAQDVASIAGGQSGVAFNTDVQPGKTRCHARASVYTHMQLDAADFYGSRKGQTSKFTEIRRAGSDAAKALGGKGFVTKTGKTRR